MKAVIYEKYGPPQVLKPAKLKKPVPKSDELLIRIYAATVTAGDVRLRSSDFPPMFWLPARMVFGLFKPKKRILGHEFSGVVEAVGNNVSLFKPGDAVFGTTTMLKTGSYAEYVCVPQSWKHGVVEIKPQNLTFEEAAAIPVGAMTALYLLEKAGLQSGQKVLLYGASGSVGSYAIQIAKHQGATVTGVCSRSNFEMIRSLGADIQIDYKVEDYSKINEKFDIVFDAVGKTTKSKAKPILNQDGRYVSVNMMTAEMDDHFKQLKEQAEAGKIKPFIDRFFTLDQVVEAHTYVGSGHKRGNVVIKVHT
jgi:NADPH:quinone reductase-like Zn-dependent oxidoreductase